MERNYGIGLFSLFCFLVCQTAAQALGHPNPGLPALVQEADAICIGRITHIQDLGPTQVDLGYRNSYTNELSLTAATDAVAEVAVQSVLKGKVSQKSIKVTFYKNVHQGPNPTFFTELAAGETDVIFLTAEGDGVRFFLAQPNTDGKSKIVLGDAKIRPIPATTPPLRAVLLTLVDALVSGSKPVKMECLDRIGSVGYLLYAKAGVYVDEAAVESRSSLREPLLADGGPSSLEAFIQAKVLPVILKLTMDKDADLRDQAVIVAARLQDVGVIPALAKIADKQYRPGQIGIAASVLSEYRNQAATRALVGVLGDSNPNVRSQAAASLRISADPVAVPALLEHLEDPSPDARYYIVAALFTATNTADCPGAELFRAKENDYVSSWKKWANDHQDKVAALREQFLAPLPLKAVPLKAVPLKAVPPKAAN